MRRFSLCCCVAIAALSRLAITTSASTITNIDLEGYRSAGGGNNGVPPLTYVGTGAAGGGTVFNGINPTYESDNTASMTTGDNKTFNVVGLLDSSGAAAGVNFSIGQVGVDNENSGAHLNTDASSLFADYVFNHSAGNNTNATFTISGLAPGSAADVYLYYSNAPSLTITGGILQTFLPTGIFTASNAEWYKVVVDASGDISGALGSGVNVFSGLTIVSNVVPEPSSVISLGGVGAMGLFVFARRRRKAQAAVRS